MSLASVLTGAKTVLSDISGIVAVYDHTDMPESLDSAKIPALLCIPRRGDVSLAGAGSAETTHSVRIVLVGKAGGQGTAAARLSQLVPLVEPVRDAIYASLHLDVATVSWAEITNYEFVTFEIGSNAHAAVEFTLTVHEREAVSVNC